MFSTFFTWCYYILAEYHIVMKIHHHIFWLALLYPVISSSHLHSHIFTKQLLLVKLKVFGCRYLPLHTSKHMCYAHEVVIHNIGKVVGRVAISLHDHWIPFLLQSTVYWTINKIFKWFFFCLKLQRKERGVTQQRYWNSKWSYFIAVNEFLHWLAKV